MKKTLLIAIFAVAGLGLTGTSAKAWFYQPQPYHNYQYQQYYNPYNYGYQDTASQLIQGQLYFVANFNYVPSPIRSYFNWNYSPFNYWGW